jgi:hypothetical protein
MKRIGLLLAIPAAVAGCTSSGDGSSPSSEPANRAASSAAAAAYVEQLNTLCDRLIPKVLDIRIGPEGSVPTMRQFVIEHPKLETLYETFDAKVDAIPADGAAQQVAEVFDDYRQWLAKWDARFVAGAATGQPSKYNAVQVRFDQAFNGSAEVADLHAAGIECPAR